MTDIKIENIVAYAKIADSFNIQQLTEEMPEFLYNPDDFSGVTIKLDEPKTAVLVLPNGRAICTGAKTIEDVDISIKKVANKLKKAGFTIKSKLKIETQNIIASIDVDEELHLSSISKGLILESVDYEPENFPGLIYKMDDLGVILILFSSGKIICNGARTEEDASKALEMMKEKLSSIGAF